VTRERRAAWVRGSIEKSGWKNSQPFAITPGGGGLYSCSCGEF
jgi:hypothetical protein